VGLGIWTLAVAGSGAAIGFWSLVVCRMFVGVGAVPSHGSTFNFLTDT